jgi:hypothetical protein
MMDILSGATPLIVDVRQSGSGPPSGQSPERGVALGFAVYNASATVILSVAGVAGAADGWLLWPVVGIHGILVVMLIVLSFRVGRTS